MYSILITKPIRTFDRIIHVPSPVVLMHAKDLIVSANQCVHTDVAILLSECSIDTTLRGYRVTSCGEQL